MDYSANQLNVHQIAGIDDRERGFNRQVQVSVQESYFQSRLRYETLQIEAEPGKSEEEALQYLIQELHERGYTQLRTQKIFKGEVYLGTQELWVDYSDPEPPEEPSLSWFRRIQQMFSRRKSVERSY